MDTIILSPAWFLRFSTFSEIIFAIITLLLAYMAFKAFKMTKTRVTKLFTYSFGFMSLSYVAFATTHFFELTSLNKAICSVFTFIPLYFFNLLGIYSHFFFMMAGLSVLVYMTFRVPKSEIFFTLLFGSVISVFVSKSVFVVFFTLSIIYLAIVFTYYVKLYLRKGSPGNFKMMLAFLLLIIGNIFYLLSIGNASFFVGGEILVLLGYFTILYNLFSVVGSK